MLDLQVLKNVILNETKNSGNRLYDGMYGSQWSGLCTVDGDYTITDVATSTVLASIQAANSDYGSQEINNFCVCKNDCVRQFLVVIRVELRITGKMNNEEVSFL